MPRQPRIEAPGLIYHIIARGIEKRDIFTGKEDYEFFLTRLGEILEDTQAKCLAFCLMPNHFHLLFESGQIPIATTMRRLQTSYAVFFNRRYKRVGHLFQNRYKSIICQKESYLFELIRYIHLNPVRAQIAISMDGLNKFPCSGHAALMETQKYDWYQSDYVLAFFGRTKKDAKESYLKFIKDGFNMGKSTILTGGGLKRSLGRPKIYPKQRQAYDERVLGDSDFVLSLDDLVEENQVIDNTATLDDLIKIAAKINKIQAKEIRGKSNTQSLRKVRSIVAYLAMRSLGLPYAQIGRYFNVHRATAAEMVARGKLFSQEIESPYTNIGLTNPRW